MKNNQTKQGLITLITGFFFYTLLLNAPKIFQNLALVGGYIANLTGSQLILLKIATWVLVTIAILISIIIVSKPAYKKRNDHRLNNISNRRTLLIFGIFAIFSMIALFFTNKLESYYFSCYMDTNTNNLSSAFINKIYFFDGYMHAGLVSALLITFIIILAKIK